MIGASASSGFNSSLTLTRSAERSAEQAERRAQQLQRESQRLESEADRTQRDAERLYTRADETQSEAQSLRSGAVSDPGSVNARSAFPEINPIQATEPAAEAAGTPPTSDNVPAVVTAPAAPASLMAYDNTAINEPGRLISERV
ncbi:MAG: hypothetical protein ACX931_06730 [Saccharospirillum sp.]